VDIVDLLLARLVVQLGEQCCRMEPAQVRGVLAQPHRARLGDDPIWRARIIRHGVRPIIFAG
jgi:hypothetical protein